MIDVIDYRAGNAPSVLYALEHLGLPAAWSQRGRRVGRRTHHPARRRRRPRHDRLARRTGPRGGARPTVSRATACRSSASASASRCCSTTARRATRPCLGWVPGHRAALPRHRPGAPDRLERGALHPRRTRSPTELPDDGHFYFVNSYFCAPADPADVLGITDVRRRVLLRRRARQHRRHPVPRREERRAGSRAPARLRGVGAVMLTKRLIACFDVVNGRVTKAQQFQDNIDVAPAEELGAAALRRPDRRDRLLRHHRERGEAQDRPRHRARVAHHVFVPFTVGGGIRSRRRHVRGAQGRRGEDQRRLDGRAQPRDHPRGRRGVRSPVHRAEHPGEARRHPRRASRAATRCSSTARASPPVSTRSTGCGAARTSAPARSS